MKSKTQTAKKSRTPGSLKIDYAQLSVEAYAVKSVKACSSFYESILKALNGRRKIEKQVGFLLLETIRKVPLKAPEFSSNPELRSQVKEVLVLMCEKIARMSKISKKDLEAHQQIWREGQKLLAELFAPAKQT
ncbi:MAG: hypothetical protein JWO73_835 [Candidatus Taylorbacteria bacterium]|nr:hypothetical protein [Candidatus Taylorbacteria bacterium]